MNFVKMANDRPTHRSHISDAELGKQLLKKQLADLNKNPVEGFSAGLINDSDFFKWEVRTFKGSIYLLHHNFIFYPTDYDSV
jgi:ubiquitin-protein ligase